MIHEIGVELQAALRARLCPFVVVDGPERRATTTWGNERVVIEHDEGGDSYEPSRSQRPNPKHRMTRRMGVKLTIYARSPKAGAREFEHRRRAEHVLDLVLVCMGDVAATRRNAWSQGGGKFVLPADLEKSETPGGAVYEQLITFDRAVYQQDWNGAIAGEATLADITSTTKAFRAWTPDDDDDFTTPPATAETACGGGAP